MQTFLHTILIHFQDKYNMVQCIGVNSSNFSVVIINQFLPLEHTLYILVGYTNSSCLCEDTRLI